MPQAAKIKYVLKADRVHIILYALSPRGTPYAYKHAEVYGPKLGVRPPKSELKAALDDLLSDP